MHGLNNLKNPLVFPLINIKILTKLCFYFMTLELVLQQDIPSIDFMYILPTCNSLRLISIMSNSFFLNSLEMTKHISSIYFMPIIT